MKIIRQIGLALVLLAPATVHAETKEEWVTLGARIHGAFGPFIPVEGLKYTIADEWLPKILGWIKSDPSTRYDSAMSADGLFQVEAVQ
jgi:hypothetical protein